MSATTCLRIEHEIILGMIDCFELAIKEAELGDISNDDLLSIVDFFQGFADTCHHCKEEDQLFPTLEQHGIPREGGPIGVMIHEHGIARRLVKAMAEQLEAHIVGDVSAMEHFIDHGRQYIDLMRGHIGKENPILFGMADQVVHGEALDALTKAYEEAASEDNYCETMKRCMAIADRLIEVYGVTRTDCQPPN